MTYLDALILGIVEGLTEFLPVSSTGHLILTSELLGLDGEDVDSYVIVIQLGAILAVLALYRHRAMETIQGLMGKNAPALGLLLRLLTAFFPAVILALLFEDAIEKHLFHPYPVAMALIVGGVAMIAVERLHILPKIRKEGEDSLKSIEEMTYRDALFIGLAQCLALWPGTSRSMSTIIGAQLCGFRNRDAAEISFLLALPTLGGATLYTLIKDKEILTQAEGGAGLILFGNVVAFVVAFLAVKWFVAFVTRHGMTPFGVYRIIIGLVFLGFIARGII